MKSTFLNKIPQDYFKRVGIDTINVDTSFKVLEKLYLLFTKNFVEESLCLDDYASLCQELLIICQNKNISKEYKDEISHDFFFVCHYGAELSWYVRNKPDLVGNMLEHNLNYYKENS